VVESAIEVDGRLVWGPTTTYARRMVPCLGSSASSPPYLAGRPNGPDDLVFTAPQCGPLLEQKSSPASSGRRRSGRDSPTSCGSMTFAIPARACDPRRGEQAVQHHLGHRSASITLDRYGHLFPEELDHLAEYLDRLHAQAAVSVKDEPARRPGVS
jgi:hypothetical protein